MKNRSSNTLLLLASIGVSLGIGELLMRVTVGLPPARPLPQVRYDPHPVRGFTLRPGQEGFTYESRVRVDQDGFRRNGGTERGQARARILALGDSFTFGMGVSDSETWPSQLEDQLNGSTPGGVRVINGGTVSYGVLQELDLLEESLLSSSIDLLIHALFWNDYMPPASETALTSEGYFSWNTPPEATNFLARVKRALVSNSALVRTARRAVESWRDRDAGLEGYESAYRRLLDGDIDPEKWRTVEDFYRELKRLGEEHGFRLFVVVLPVIDVVQLPRPSDHPYPRFVTGLLERLEIPYLDGIALWEARGLGGETFLTENRHLGAPGYRVLADALAVELRRDPEIGALLSPTRAP